MKQFLIRLQLVFVSIILLGTFAMTMSLIQRHNRRWDLTREKIYSLSAQTLNLLSQMQSSGIEVVAFYPQDDPQRGDFETFLKECQMRHHQFHYQFYDPDRSPQMAKKWRVKSLQTVIIRFDRREERLTQPTEEALANALLRLLKPKSTSLCFVTGHGEAGIWSEERNGLKLFREVLEENNYVLHEILLARDKVPAFCQLLIVAGPQRDWGGAELDLLKESFREGQSILFLVDPVDPGTGKSFEDFMKSFGVRLGPDVIVDKMSRMVGGDFLVPFVNQYAPNHPLTRQFDVATFFPVARSVQVAAKMPEGLQAATIAFTGSGSWAETNLDILEKGEAAFEAETDFPGPLSLAVAVENVAVKSGEEKPEERMKKQGRLVAVGDSDFITNTYLDLSGNKELALKMIQWLVRDDRSVALHKEQSKFEPLFLDAKQRLVLLVSTLVGYPVFFIMFGSVWILTRR